MRKLRALRGLSQKALAHEKRVNRSARGAQRVGRQHHQDCLGTRGPAVEAAEGWVMKLMRINPGSTRQAYDHKTCIRRNKCVSNGE